MKKALKSGIRARFTAGGGLWLTGVCGNSEPQ
jgi:hypothetical protein